MFITLPPTDFCYFTLSLYRGADFRVTSFEAEAVSPHLISVGRLMNRLRQSGFGNFGKGFCHNLFPGKIPEKKDTL